MAVPIRGQLLADILSPVVGTILETHPLASLYLGLAQNKTIAKAISGYKKRSNPEYIAALWRAWSTRFQINSGDVPGSDGALDAIVCATIAYLFQHSPAEVLRLRHKVQHKNGRGPFNVWAERVT